MSNNSKQAKVSMVMPCYNKADYIAEMLDSIIAQKWDNIELIMVNDGSTDKTREIIKQYLPKLKERGFDAIVIEQENAGVCAAGKNGLSHITGEYACLVDSDDELDPEYVSIPISFLEFHQEYDYTACHYTRYQGVGNNKSFIEVEPRPIEDGCKTVCEMYLTERINMTVWVYMVRTRYLRECGIPDSYFIQTKGSHEPGYVIPLTANKGKVKYLPLPLYRFNCNGEGHSRFERFEQAEYFHLEYLRLALIAVERLGDNISNKRKERLMQLCHIFCYFNGFVFAKQFAIQDKVIYEQIINKLNAYLIDSKLRKRAILSWDHFDDWHGFIKAIQNEIITPRKRILSEERNIVIFGAGVNGHEFYRRYFDDFHFLAFVDNNEAKYGSRYFGLETIPPSEIQKLTNFAVVVCVRNQFDIVRQLIDMGIKSFWLICDEQVSESRYMNFSNLTLMDFNGYEDLNFTPQYV